MSAFFTGNQSLNIFLINMVAVLMISAKLDTLGLPEIKIF